MKTARSRVAVVEDIASLRASLEELIAELDGFEFAGSAGSGEDALKHLPEWAPDVVLMDIQLPGMSGVGCVRQLKERMPDTEFMMLTIFEDHEQVFASLRAGASGYLIKGLSPRNWARRSGICAMAVRR